MISIKIKSEGPIPLVIPEGRLDFANSTEFDQALRPLLDSNKYLIIDLSQCNYLSSAGIRILLMSQKRLLAKGGGIYLSGLAPEVYQVIEMAGMQQVFHLFKTPDAARVEIEKVKHKASEYIEWSESGFSFRFHMIENDRKAALLWKNDGVAGYNELEYSVGTGSPAETPEDDKLAQGIFVTCGGCAGFIPNDEELPPDFRVPGNPADAGVFVNMALSFGGQPTGLVRISEQANIPFDLLAHSLYPVKKQITSDLLDLMALVIVDFNPHSPSVSFCLVVDSLLNDSLKLSGFHEIPVFTSVGDPGINLWGAKFVLSEVPDIPEGISLSNFLKNTLTIENIINVDVINPEDSAVNPVTWLFISNGLSDAFSKRLQIEKRG